NLQISMKITLTVGATRHPVEIPEDATVKDLMQTVVEKCKITPENQKLIHRGVTISSDPEKLLTSCDVKSRSRVMVIGKRYDDGEDVALHNLEMIEKDVRSVMRTFDELHEQIDSIMKGFLDEEHKNKAFKQIKKKLLTSSHLLMQSLETMDQMVLGPEFSNARRIRKTMVDKIQSALTSCDKLVAMVDKFIAV
uniref:BAG family molecular chaperone regulator 1 n=2 Tax=Ciona intestinalis TaxID=7719 RepID=F6YQ21_CIOIN